MNAHGLLMDAWITALGTLSVDVFRIDVPETQTGNYVIVRPEGGTGVNNKRSINDTVVIITDVVTEFENNATQATADAIDAEIFDKIIPNPQGVALTGAGIEVLNIERENFEYLQTADNVKTYYRKVSRYSHRLHQTT